MKFGVVDITQNGDVFGELVAQPFISPVVGMERLVISGFITELAAITSPFFGLLCFLPPFWGLYIFLIVDFCCLLKI
ncbi:MAG: hypothetical protein A2V45_08210 [Candidatus Aminicenantes bacterium RBG_19FT_COMBO_58_17]|nr:MAG: hypothetical protein A2V45_08210 [Candidatus Aminicenantes bacterium RBG_19FT_COMBO_58_17]